MADFDFVAAQTKIAEINKIVETRPDAVKEKAFELLFRLLFDKPPAPASDQKIATPKAEGEAAKRKTRWSPMP